MSMWILIIPCGAEKRNFLKNFRQTVGRITVHGAWSVKQNQIIPISEDLHLHKIGIIPSSIIGTSINK